MKHLRWAGQQASMRLETHTYLHFGPHKHPSTPRYSQMCVSQCGCVCVRCARACHSVCMCACVSQCVYVCMRVTVCVCVHACHSVCTSKVRNLVFSTPSVLLSVACFPAPPPPICCCPMCPVKDAPVAGQETQPPRSDGLEKFELFSACGTSSPSSVKKSRGFARLPETESPDVS